MICKTIQRKLQIEQQSIGCELLFTVVLSRRFQAIVIKKTKGHKQGNQIQLRSPMYDGGES